MNTELIYEVTKVDAHINKTNPPHLHVSATGNASTGSHSNPNSTKHIKMKKITIKRALLVIIIMYTLNNSVIAQDCDQVLKDGVFNTTAISTRTDLSKSFYQYIYSTDFTTHQQAIDAGISIGVPVFGVPLELGGKFSKQQKDEWKRTHQEYKNETMTLSQKYNALFKYASPDILESWNKCIYDTRTTRVGLYGWIEAIGSRSGVLHVTWNPPPGDRGGSPMILTSNIVGGLRSDNSQSVAFPKNYRLLQGVDANIIPLTRKVDEPLVVVIHTTRGDFPCILEAPPKPRILSFVTAAEEVSFGESTTLIWNVSKSEQVSLDNSIGSVAANGSYTVTPQTNTTYKLTATNFAGSINSQVTVNVKPLPPVLTGARIWFQTTDDDKDDDTRVTVSIKSSGNTVANWSGIEGEWRDNMPTGPYTLTVIEKIKKEVLLSSGQYVLVETPNGKDEWHFNYGLELYFSDGTSKRYDWTGGDVDHDRNTITKPLQ